MLGFKQWEQAIASRQYQNPPEREISQPRCVWHNPEKGDLLENDFPPRHSKL